MGAIHFSVDQRLVTLLVDALKLSTFIETGTFHGDSLASVSGLFAELHSIELSQELCLQARQRFAGHQSVKLHQGDSPIVLARMRSIHWQSPTFFWLDAHWCADSGAVGESSSCPLLGELAAIETIHEDSVIAIDDARLFLAAPPANYHAGDWPSFQQINNALHSISPAHELTVLDDVLWFHPPRTGSLMTSYAREFGADWLKLRVMAAAYDEHMAQLTTKETAIAELSRAAEERLGLIKRLERELHERERESSKLIAGYRLALELNCTRPSVPGTNP